MEVRSDCQIGMGRGERVLESLGGLREGLSIKGSTEVPSDLSSDGPKHGGAGYINLSWK